MFTAQINGDKCGKMIYSYSYFQYKIRYFFFAISQTVKTNVSGKHLNFLLQTKRADQNYQSGKWRKVVGKKSHKHQPTT